jgi:hypothetical protein
MRTFAPGVLAALLVVVVVVTPRATVDQCS